MPGYLKWLRGDDRGSCRLAVACRLPPPKPQAFMGLTSKVKSSRRSGVEAKRQLSGKFKLHKTCVANCSVELDTQPDNTINSSASTSIPAPPQPLAPTHFLAEGTPLLDPSPPPSIHGPALSASTPPSLVRMTLAPPLLPAQPDPSPLPPPEPRPNRVTFSPGISEDIPYVTMAQAPYPPPVEPPTDDLADTAKATAREIINAPSLLSFLASNQRNTLGGLSKGVNNPAADLLQTYV